MNFEYYQKCVCVRSWFFTAQIHRHTTGVRRGHLVRDLDNGNQMSAIFMDFQKAFDRVWHTGLVHKLRTLGVQPNSVSWLSSFLTDRTIAVRVGSCLSSQHTISAGVPQGSHLGPILFLVFIHDLPDHVNIPTEFYADDALLHHTTALSVKGALQIAVLAAEQWALQWHGRFGQAKTKQLNIEQRQFSPCYRYRRPPD